MERRVPWLPVPVNASSLLDLARSPGGTKMIRYTLVSVVSVIVSQLVLFVLQVGFHMGALTANLIACAVATVPSYELNRKWAWGKSGKSHLMKEVVPFWALAFLGLAFSSWAVVEAEAWAKHHHLAHVTRSLTVNGASLAAFGILWVAKFVIFNKILFAHHPEQLEPALDGRTGLPT